MQGGSMVDAFLPPPVARHKAMLVVIPVVWCVAPSEPWFVVRSGCRSLEQVRVAVCVADSWSIDAAAASPK